MFARYLTSGAIVLALVGGHAERAEADAFVGGLVGGFIGGAIGSNTRTRPRYTTQRVIVTSPQRQQNREVQTALNHFGFNVGAADGSIGPQTRAGITRYQAYLEFPQTGQLTDFERMVLLGAYQRSQMGGPQVTRITSRHRDGLRGLLPTVLDEMRGTGARSAGAYGLPPEIADAVDEIAESSDPSAEQLVQRSGFVQLADLNGDGRTDYILNTAVTGSSFWCGARDCTVLVFASTPDGYSRNDFLAQEATPAMFSCQRGDCALQDGETTTTAAAATDDRASANNAEPDAPESASTEAAAPAMPNFFGGQEAADVSLATHCNRVGLVTNANGGQTDIDTMDDPVFALNEQFCLARSFAIADGEALAEQVPNATPATIAEQCDGFAPVLEPHVDAVARQSRDEVLNGVESVIRQSGMSASDLTATARICLSSGYMTDTMPVAIGSALLLSAMGETGYGELVGHHLMQGIGVAQRDARAREWYSVSVPSADEPRATQVGFAPGPESRNALIHHALAMLDGSAGTPRATRSDASAPDGGLPVFELVGD
ncbi:MAG: putative peptidoglycan binding domain [Rhodobacteraceae bacterium HLUCCA12]|nr:MAG: putative peptidoglycan binding domain [Rhodobacteraceae bacterium HLUCCA12]